MRKTTFITAVIMLLMSANLFATTVLKVGDQKQQLRILLQTSGVLDDIPYQIAFFEFPAAAPLGEALNAAAVDVGIIGDAPFVFASGAGRGLKAVTAIENKGAHVTAILVNEDSAIKNPADLKGKTIVTTRGSVGHYLLLEALRNAGLDISDVKPVFLLPADARALLSSKRVDAWSTWAPYTTISVNADNTRIIASSDDYRRSNSLIAATAPALQNKAEQIQDFVNRLAKAYLWAADNIEIHARIQSQVTGLPYEIHLELEKHIVKKVVAIDSDVIASVQSVADVYYAEKLLRRKTDVSGSFETRFNITEK